MARGEGREAEKARPGGDLRDLGRLFVLIGVRVNMVPLADSLSEARRSRLRTERSRSLGVDIAV